MVALNTAYAAPKNAADPKNRVGDFFYEDHASVGKNHWASRLNTQEKSCYHYETASGRSNWSNRDPIQEQGGLNLYAMVQNNPIDYWDYLGMSNCGKSWWDKTKEVVSTVVDVVPVAGTVKSVVEVVTGKDPITGEPVNRAVAAAGIGASLIPGGKAALKTGVKAASALSDGAKSAGKSGLKGVPDNFVETPSKKGGGTKYSNPDNKSEVVRDMPGNPNSPNPAQKEPYVKHTRDGKALDREGSPVDTKSPEAHIPRDNFQYRP